MADQKNRRTAPTVQDVISGTSGRSRAKFKSGYTGPKKAPGPGTAEYGLSHTGTLTATQAPPTPRSGGILDYAWAAYSLTLAIALITAVAVYGRTGGRDGIHYPNNIFTISGVVKDIFYDYNNGGLGSGLTRGAGTAAGPVSSYADGENAAENAADSDQGTSDNTSLLGEGTAAGNPNSTTGATMALDTGSAYGNYAMAASYDELLEQLDSALAANDYGFVGTKLAYTDTGSGELIGYPQSVVEHFTKYMADNPDKRATFLAEIKDESQFSAMNGSAYIVKLPLLQFTINMGYDGTTISISGFADQQMDSGQSAVVSPLLPCMYTIHAQTAKGSQTSEVECNMNEGNLKINIGVSN